MCGIHRKTREKKSITQSPFLQRENRKSTSNKAKQSCNNKKDWCLKRKSSKKYMCMNERTKKETKNLN